MGAVIGALAAFIALTLSTRFNPAILIDFDADLPRPVASGFYDVERNTQETYAWTSALATITLRGIDRAVPWTCTIRMRGARPAGLPEPEAALGIDGITVRTEPGRPDYSEIDIEAPPLARSKSLSLTIRTTPTFVPGDADKRQLGVQVDRIQCVPTKGAAASAPSRALLASVCAGAVFGALFAMLAPLLAAAVEIAIFSAALASVISRGMAAYSAAYLEWIVPVAAWSAIAGMAFALLRSSRGRATQPAGAFVLAFSSAVLFLKIIALLHPSKDVVDAVFHAHRLEAVLAGNYFFTQPMPGGVRFPYAIGLYVTAAPWATLLPDHVALLRIVVCVFEGIAAALLYTAVSKSWGDHLAGAAAVVLYHAAPLPYLIIGNANLTFAFAQSVSVMALVAAVLLPFQRRWAWSALALMLIAALAFLSHVGVFPVVALSLVALGVLYLWRGGADLRIGSWSVLGATTIAAVLSIGIYYARFPEVWSTLDRVRSPLAGTPAGGASPSATSGPAPLSIAERAARAAAHGKDDYGLPLLFLASAGLWLVWKARDGRLTLGLAAWAVGFAAFLAFRIVAPVDARLQRYADEFIDRLYYITLPVIAVLAARAAAAGWRRGGLARWTSVALVLLAAAAAVAKWSDWTQ
jgi:hypothetical protein